MVHDILELFLTELVAVHLEATTMVVPTKRWWSVGEAHSWTSILAVTVAYPMSFYFPCLYNY